jgi:cbb3-type cytochrome oxidase subunit 3
MMRQMLANIEQYPSVGIFVLVSFVMIFSVILIKLFGTNSKKECIEAANIPLSDEENRNE